MSQRLQILCAAAFERKSVESASAQSCESARAGRCAFAAPHTRMPFSNVALVLVGSGELGAALDKHHAGSTLHDSNYFERLVRLPASCPAGRSREKIDWRPS